MPRMDKVYKTSVQQSHLIKKVIQNLYPEAIIVLARKLSALDERQILSLLY